jgi:hypothetical protein
MQQWKWTRGRLDVTPLMDPEYISETWPPPQTTAYDQHNAILWMLRYMLHYMCSKDDFCIHLLYGFPAKSALEFLQEDWILKYYGRLLVICARRKLPTAAVNSIPN